ncbi:ABC transporter substrate-binding protein [Paenibacillus sacheonensis]|uniref:Extracellular solute-binding protein n=1 Tax=Paenibacillus sacheonensis TaxID=742054 RepID=A0A7X4YMZ7_9BACL|nr:extracellular solute-binding protein [Paenibacillus sacheonensis]MBM7564742.1 raffinose/stachyose/melibiose transport system substrate-binding protein [Paenibacillus sacheonensis]NBC69297.1 extracellular solute-binding protein [Paenibacillus sacheonensis]
MNNRFPKLLTVLSLSAMLTLSACGSSSNNNGNAANAGGNGAGQEEESFTLKVPDAEIWGEESSALQTMYDLYEDKHPNVKLEQVTMKDDQTLAAALVSGEAPDLMLMDPSAAKERFKSNYIAPMDEYYTKYGWDQTMYKWAKNAYVEDGKAIGIPWNYEGLIVMYNESMFKENGWTIPTNYNELMALVPKIKDKGIMPFAWGSSDNPGVDDWWVTSIVNSVLGPEGTKQLFSGDTKWTDPTIVDAIQRYSDFWNAGYVTDKKSYAISQEDSMQLFLTGKAAMRLDGTWALASDNEPDFDIGFAPFPSWKKDGTPVIPLGVGGGLVINAQSEHKDAVAELLNDFFSPEVVKEMAAHGIPEPVETDFSTMELKPNVSKALDMINEAAQAGSSGYVAWSYGPPRVVQVLESDFPSVYLKKTTVQDWLGNLQKLKEQDVAEKRLFDLQNY